MAIFDNKEIINQTKSEFEVEIFPLTMTNFININDSNRLISNFRTLKGTCDDFFSDVFTYYHYHFKFYFLKRLPQLLHQYRLWLNLFIEESPSLIVTSQLFDSESQIPTIAAKKLGINTISIPHGAGIVGDEVLLADEFITSDNLNRQFLISGGISPDKVTVTKVLPYNEYKLDAQYQWASKERLNILVLLCNTTLEGILMPYVSIGSQINILKSIKLFSQQFNGKVKVVYKLHPGWPDTITLQTAGINDSDILPINSNIQNAINQADLVVDVNLSSLSAITQAIEQEKPIIFYYNQGYTITYLDWKVLLTAGHIVKNHEEFYDLIKRILDKDNTMIDYLKAKSTNFKKKYLNYEKSIKFQEVIKRFCEPSKDVDTTEVHSNSVIKIDIEDEFYYGEIPREQFEKIIKESTILGSDVELVTRRFCDMTKNDYFRRYALDPRRALCINLLGDVTGRRVLDFGCGLGSLGFVFAKKGAKVTFVDKCISRLEFARLRSVSNNLSNCVFYAVKEWSSLPFREESFDVILLNGILEWIADTPEVSFQEVERRHLNFLSYMSKILSPSGNIYLAIENRFALRYFLGYPEDHTEIRYISIMDRESANKLHLSQKGTEFKTWTWGYIELKNLLKKIGLHIDEEYGIFPDYRFPQRIVSLSDHKSIANFIKEDLHIMGLNIPQDINRWIDYLTEMQLIHQFVYSFAFLIKKCYQRLKNT